MKAAPAGLAWTTARLIKKNYFKFLILGEGGAGRARLDDGAEDGVVEALQRLGAAHGGGALLPGDAHLHPLPRRADETVCAGS